MKKSFLSLLLVLMTTVLYAGKEELYVLYEGFENGIPATWSQINEAGQQQWIIESATDAQYPTGVVEGEYRAALRNTTTQTQHFVTKLVTPVFDISKTVHPILMFSHAQAQRTGDVDQLKVYYRQSATDRWIEIASFENKITNWTQETIQLPGACETYQLAFEGTDNFGRGIVIDDVIVRPEPTCEDPFNISVDGLSTNSVTLLWNGSLDTEKFRVVLSKKQITDMEQPEGIVYDNLISDFSVTIDELNRNTKYYVYIQAQCGVENSEWSSFTFTTKNMVNVPYTQTFDKSYASGTVSHPDYWTCGTSIKKDDGSMEFMPFINQNTDETGLKNFSFSNTTCLVFTGARSTSKLIPAGEYVYSATPELNVENVKNLQATFWGTCHTYYNEANANGLVIGVMTDPADFSTFVAVDTVYLKGAQLFDRFTVYFDNYTGEGKFIAFASNFVGKDNIFFMDDLSLEINEGIKTPTNVSLNQVSSKSITVNANMNGATASKVYLTKHVIDAKTGQVQLNPLAETFGAENILATYDVNSFPYVINLPDSVNGMFVQVYVQNVMGDQAGAFALPVKQLVPKRWDGESDLLINFDDTEVSHNYGSSELKNFWNNTSSYNYPYEMITDFFTQPGLSSSSTVYTVRYPLLGGTTAASKYHSAKGAVYLKRDRRVFGDGTEWIMPHGQYMALPEVVDLSTFFLQFYLASYSDSHPEAAGVVIGAMTDPFDITTFDTIATVTCGNDWKMAIVSFADYKGQGHFPAIMAATMLTDDSWSGGSGSGSGSSYKDYYMGATWVDDIQYLKAGGCMPATDLKDEVSYDQATLTWNANQMEQWVVTVYADEAKKDTVANDTVTVPTYTVKELKPHTLYYYDVVALCDDKEFPADPATFTTECLPAENIPYVEDFEAYASGSTTHIVPACWNIMQQKVYYPGGSSGEPASTSWYPYVGSSTYAHTGTKGFYFQYYKKTSGYTITPLMDDQPSFIALPLMAEELNKLQMTFWMKAGGVNYVGDTVYVGVMSDPTNLATFDTVQLVKTTKDYSENIVRFNNYKGQGKYIAFLKTPRELARACYLDDIKVDYLAECEKVQGVTATNANEIGATISWNKGDATQWEIVVANKELTVDEIAAQDIAIVKDSVTSENPFVVDFCDETNKAYYVYVRAICDEKNKGDWSNVISFKTTCVAKTPEGYGFIDFATTNFKTAEFPCWIVGRREGTTAVPSITDGSHLYMFNTASSEGAYAIMPPIDVEDISKLQVKFTASGGTGAAYLRQVTVGIITNSTDLSTFEAIETVDLPKAVTTISKANHAKNLDEAQTFIVRFDKYKGDYEGNYGKQIMFLSENGGVANYVYIYSMQVSEIPSCLEPLKVEAVEVNTYDATVGWEEVGTNYQVQLLADDKVTVLVDSITNKQQMKFEGLTMLTKYYAQVRTICGIGDTSAWSPMGNFTTQCPVAYPVPYEQNFDDYASGGANFPDCWERFCNYTGTTTTYQPYINSSAKKDGKNGMQMYGSTSYYSYAVLPPMADKLSNLMLEFDYRSNSTSYAMTMVVGVATDVTSLEGLDTTFVPLDTITADKWVAANANWYHYAQSFDDYTGEGQIVFYSPKFPSSSNGYAYLDNIYVSKTPTCFRPIDLAFASATASSITLTWTPQGNETAWDIACLLAGEEDMTKAVITTVSGEGPKGVVTGLQNSTDYDFYVRANCGGGDFSEWSSVLTAATLCIVPLAEANWEFDDYTTQIQSPYTTTATYKEERCWLVGNKNSTSYSYIPYLNKNAYSSTYNTVSSKYACTDSSALKFYSTTSYNGAYAVMPEIVGNLDEMQVSFVGRAVYESYSTAAATAGQFTKYYNLYATGTYQRGIKVGTVTDPYDMSTFEELVDYQFAEVTNANCSTKVEGDYWEPVTVSLYGAKGKYIAFLSEYDASNYAWIDNVKVETESGLNMPTLIRLNEETLTGEHADITWKSRANKFDVVVTNDTGLVIYNKVQAEQALSLDNLTMLTNYIVTIKAMNEAGTEYSAPAVFKFRTPCMPYTKDNAKWDFSAASATYAYTGSTTYKIPECWEAGQLTKGGTSATYMPQVKVSTATAYTYGRLDDATDGALQFYNYSNTYGDSYAVLPELNVNYDSTALHFWVRAAYFWPAGAALVANKNKIREANTNYPKDLLIGTIKDMSDMTTFVEQDKVTYPYELAATTYNYNDETGNNYWIEVILPLKKYKDQGRIVLYYPLGQKTGYMFIDDVEVIDADFCTPITNINAKNVTATAADITWSFTGKDSVQLQLSTSDNFEDSTAIIVDSIMADAEGLFQIATLDAGTDYYVRLMHFCSEEDASDWTVPFSFTTLFNIRFNEQFTEVRTYPTHWSRANARVVEVLDNGVTPNPVAESITANWVRDNSTSDITATTGSATGSSSSVTYYNYWLMTPTISLKDIPKADKLMLSFDLSLSASDGSQPFNKPSEFDQFIVVVSTDGGKTYPRANATIWNAEGNDRKYSDISGVPTKQMVDLSSYAGQDIVIAFVTDAHSELEKACSKNDVHLDNVQINGCDVFEYSADICQYNDYEDDNFFIDANDLIVDKTTVYTKYDAATKDGVNDTYTQLSLTVNCAVTTTKSVTLCEGENYLDDNFAIYNVVESATYKQKLEAASGCDSISEVVITVLPRIYNIVEKTICQGDFFEFGGVKYYTSTIVSDTVPSIVTGCDSITTLYLTVNAILAGTTETDLCEGDTIVFGKYTITEGGTYVDTLKNALGCDSVATLVVTMRENYATMKRAAICQGEKYSDDVFQGLGQAGDYPSEQKSIYGCDSIVTLHLLVANEDLKLEDKIEVDELPYIINGQELLPIGTVEGSYQRTIDLNCGMATITILVGNVSALPQVKVDDLTVNPNPVQVGEAFYVSGPFAGNATMTIVNANGQNIYTATGVQSPVVVPGLPVTGVYMITITSTNGTYATKVMAY